ncbi:MAG: hypothetical protein ACLP70_04795 [Streptosporangiaceae bacterium]
MNVRRNALGSGYVDDSRLAFLHAVGPLLHRHVQVQGVWMDTSAWNGVIGAELTIDGETVLVYYSSGA